MLKALTAVLRVILFYLLLWLRVPVVLVLQAFTSLAAIAFVVMLVVRGWENAFSVFWPMLLISFGAFVVRWIYDGVLMLLSPEDLLLDI
jgi:hypothetical protein